MTAEDRLLQLPRFATDTAAYKPGLDRMRALLASLGTPHLGLPVVHVAGTNGKGSTSSLAASVAGAAGLRVGLHTSPHLLTLRERMRIDGVPAPADWLADALDRHGEAIEAGGVSREAGAASFFEATVALSLLYFADRSVDLAVVEVGLGGRLDATNVVEPVVSAVTHVGLDHTDLLGETVEEIAVEKAGIARPGVPFVHAVEGAASGALEAEARRRGAPVESVRQSCRVEALGLGRIRLATPVRDYGEVEVGLPGPHQAWNAALAVRAVEVAFAARGAELSAEAVRLGLAEVVERSGLRGRGEAWAGDPRVVLDVAHNADGWRAALGAVDTPGRLWALVGMMADKDARALGRALAVHGARALAIGLDGDRALPASALASALRDEGVPVEVVDGAATALDMFHQHAEAGDRFLVTGSHQTVAAVLARTPPGSAG